MNKIINGFLLCFLWERSITQVQLSQNFQLVTKIAIFRNRIVTGKVVVSFHNNERFVRHGKEQVN